jgi:hypothetical protein
MGQRGVDVWEFTHLSMQWRWKAWLQAPQMSGQSSPGNLQSGQQPSNAILHMPHVSSCASHVQEATACHWRILTFIGCYLVYNTWCNAIIMRTCINCRLSDSHQAGIMQPVEEKFTKSCISFNIFDFMAKEHVKIGSYKDRSQQRTTPSKWLKSRSSSIQNMACSTHFLAICRGGLNTGQEYSRASDFMENELCSTVNTPRQ